MEIQTLRNFLVLSEELHFRKAADRLHLSQPPLSRQLQDLEREFAATLMLRGRRRDVSLTPAGEVLRLRAAEILSILEVAREEVRQIASGKRGKLRIGMASAMAYGPVPSLIRKFCDLHEGVEIDLRELTTSSQEEEIRTGKLDLGFTYPPLVSKGLRSRIVASETISVALPASKLQRSRGLLPPKRWFDQPILIFPRRESPGLYDLLMSVLSEERHLRIIEAATELQTVLGFVAAGMGAALVPATMTQVRRPGIIFRRLKWDGPPVQTLAVWRAGKPDPLRDLFIKSLPSLRH